MPVHPAAIRAQAEAELAALRGQAQAQRCCCAAHVGAVHRHARPGPGAEPSADTAGRTLPALCTLYAIPLEVWAAQR